MPARNRDHGVVAAEAVVNFHGIFRIPEFALIDHELVQVLARVQCELDFVFAIAVLVVHRQTVPVPVVEGSHDVHPGLRLSLWPIAKDEFLFLI